MLFKTIQPIYLLSQITNKEEIIYSNHFPDHDDVWSFREAYQWISQNKMQHLKGKSPDQSILWAWEYSTPDNIQKANEMISHQVNGFDGKCISILFESDEDHALLSDHSMWDYVLNYWLLAQSEAEKAQWEELENKGINFYYQKPLLNKEYHEKILKSWDLCFDFKINPETGNYNYTMSEDFLELMGLKKEDCLIQATLWSIPLKNIKEVTILKS